MLSAQCSIWISLAFDEQTVFVKLTLVCCFKFCLGSSFGGGSSYGGGGSSRGYDERSYGHGGGTGDGGDDGGGTGDGLKISTTTLPPSICNISTIPKGGYGNYSKRGRYDNGPSGSQDNNNPQAMLAQMKQMMNQVRCFLIK